MSVDIGVKTYTIESGKELCISARKQTKIYRPSFTPLGANMQYETRVKGYPDLFGVLRDLSNVATWFFWTLARCKHPETNIAIYQATSANEYQKIHRAMKELKTKELVMRIKQQHYMINPKVLFPDLPYYEKAMEEWDNLK